MLLQQELLWDDKVEDPELIAEVYIEATGTSQKEASQRGSRHTKYVLKTLREQRMGNNSDKESKAISRTTSPSVCGEEDHHRRRKKPTSKKNVTSVSCSSGPSYSREDIARTILRIRRRTVASQAA